MSEEPVFRWRRIIGIACFLLILDGFLIGVPSLGSFVCLLMILASGGASLFHFFRNREIAGKFGIKAMIYLIALISIVAVFQINTEIGRRNAAHLINAISAYHSDHGGYPEKLEQLVPHYISKTPISAVHLSSPAFHYLFDPERPLLVWVKVPPFDRYVYDFKDKTWTHTD